MSSEIEFTPGGKPTYRDKHGCATCGTGYLDCHAGALMGLMCCKGCDHPTFRSTIPPYTVAEFAHMRGEKR